jgi:hypothetical protein
MAYYVLLSDFAERGINAVKDTRVCHLMKIQARIEGRTTDPSPHVIDTRLEAMAGPHQVVRV